MYSFRDANVLIAGGGGFIGSNLARKMLDLGAKVSVIDIFDPDTGANDANLSGIRHLLQLYKSDMQDFDLLCRLLQKQDYLFNLAGQSSHMKSMSIPLNDLSANVRAQLFLLEACRKCNSDIRVIFSSTRQIYGHPEYLPVDEIHPIRPVDINGIHKWTAEQYHLLYGKTYGIPISILRLTNTYGPRMRIKDANQNFLGLWIRRLLEGKPLEIWGGDQLRDFTYIDDCLNALLLAAGSKEAVNAVYNVGGIEPVSLQSLAETLIAIRGTGEYKICMFPDERKKIDVGSFVLDDRLIRSHLGWQPEISLTEGLKRTLNYFQEKSFQYV